MCWILYNHKFTSFPLTPRPYFGVFTPGQKCVLNLFCSVKKGEKAGIELSKAFFFYFSLAFFSALTDSFDKNANVRLSNYKNKTLIKRKH